MKRAPVFPPIPNSAHTVHGLVTVCQTTDPRFLADGDLGCWDGAQRIIYLRAGMHPRAAWLTLFHEQAHANLDDIAPIVQTEVLELFCNATATARFSELLASLSPSSPS